MRLTDKRQQGIAMVLALALLVVVSGVAALMFTRTLNEIRHSGDDAAVVQSLMLARGAANMGGQLMATTVRDELSAIVESDSSTIARWSFGTGTGDAPDPASVINALTNGASSVAGQLQGVIDAAVCNASLTPSGGGSATVRIFVTSGACNGNESLPAGIALPGGRFVSGNPRGGSGSAAEQVYGIPYVMVATGTLGEYRRNVVLQGEYQFTVGRGSFAKYALFTNVHEGAGGGDVWFTDRTLFDGPVHTNQYFRFYHQPWFGGKVTSAGCRTPGATGCTSNDFTRQGADFYGKGFVKVRNMNSTTSPHYGADAPELTAGVDWKSGFVPLPTNAQDQKAAAQADGIYASDPITSLTLWAGDADGNEPTRNFKGEWTPAASYQYIELCTETTVQSSGGGGSRGRRRGGWSGGGYGGGFGGWGWGGGTTTVETCTSNRFGPDGELFEQADDGTWQATGHEFNGVIYGDQGVGSFSGPERSGSDANDPATAPPALASFAQITVASDETIAITGDLTYEDAPCSGAPTRNGDGSVTPATCDNRDARNVLGVYAQSGDITIGNLAQSLYPPRDVTIDGVLMSGEGAVTVDGYDAIGERGAVNLLGGIIEYNYGAFGTFNAGTGQNSTGYGRIFTYDQRMSDGLAPPFFPTVGDDHVRSVSIFSYGQREQVY